MGRLFCLFYFVLILQSCAKENPVPQEIKLPTITMEPISVLEGAKESSIFISLRLSHSPEQAVSITLSTVDGTATSEEDFTPITNKQISMSPGEIQSSCKITIIGDSEYEADESFMVEIISATGADIGTKSVEITIENDDLDLNIDIPTSGYTTPDRYENMSLIWQDEFEGDALDESFWTYEIGNGNSGWGNNELQYYRKENTFIQDGNLIIPGP